jgi:hypothetical protein
MRSLNGDKELWTRLSVEELEKREEYTQLVNLVSEPKCCFQVCCYDCCIQVCCFQLMEAAE